MNPFKILQIRKEINEAKASPELFTKQKSQGFLYSFFIAPLLIAFIVCALFFIIGYTDIFGFQIGFFKFLFWAVLVVGIFIFSIMRKIIRFISKKVSKQTKNFVDAVGHESKDINDNNL